MQDHGMRVNPAIYADRGDRNAGAAQRSFKPASCLPRESRTTPWP